MGFLKNLFKMKTVKGLGVVAIGIGISLIPVPVAQAVGGKIAYGGVAAVIVGIGDKTNKAVKAKKGERWMAITEQERKMLKKIRKNEAK